MIIGRRRPPVESVIAALLLFPCASWAEVSPVRLTRLHDSPTPGFLFVGPSPARVGGIVYFPAFDPKNDEAIWASDGSSPRATLLRRGRSQTAVSFGGRAFFVASNPTSSQLWQSDGTPEGTASVADLGGPSAGALTAALGRLYLAGGDGHPWSSDGTPEGTRRLSDDAVANVAPGFVPFQGSVDFLAAGGDGNLGLWSTQGTPETTRKIADLGPSQGGTHYAYGLRASSDRIYFYTSEDSSGTRYRLWSSDGTASGTAALRDFGGTLAPGCPGPCLGGCGPCRGIGPDTVGALGRILVFFADDGVHGREPWRTDGTAGGTQMLADVSPGATSGVSLAIPTSAANTATYAVFAGADDVLGAELWRTDGTAAGTQLVKDLVPGPLSSGPGSFVAVGEDVFFAAVDAIWRTDGTTAGTVPVREKSARLYPVDGGFAAVDAGGLWVSDGAAFSLVDDLARPRGLDPLGMTAFGAGVAFSRLDDDNLLHDLWRFDAASGSAGVVHHFSALGTLPAVAGGAIYLGADDGVHGNEPWISDGTAAGTRILADIAPASPSFPAAASSDPSGFIAAGSRVYFVASDAAHGLELWATDGTDPATRLVRDVAPGPPGSVPSDLTAFRGELFFTLFAPQPGGLWKTDGTDAGTQEVAGVPASWLGAAGGRLFFIGQDPATGSEPWTSDGTPAGTRIVRDTVPGPDGLSFFAMTPAGHRVFFVGQRFDDQELWTSDGTEAGTRSLGAFRSVYGLTAVGAGVFFAASDGEHGFELWASDGTPQGTRLVRDIAPGLDSSSPDALAAAGRRLLFSADDGEHGREPWISDGTPEGTRLLADVSPGPSSSRPSQFRVAGEVVYFAASDDEAGAQLWSMPADEVEGGPVTRPRGVPRTVPPRGPRPGF